MTNVYSDKSTTYSQVGAAKRILSDDLQRRDTPVRWINKTKGRSP